MAMHSNSRTVAMPRNVFAVLTVAAIVAFPMRALAQVKRDAQGPWGGKTNGLGQYADVNGIKLYYETHGAGKPLILLHGGLGAIEMFGPNLPALANGRQVIAVDLQGHGRTADIDRPLSIELMADDIAAPIKQTPMYQLYASIAPRPEDWPRLLGKIGEAMKSDFDFSKDVAGIKATTLVVAGDADIFPPAHAVEVFGLLGGGKRDGGWDGSGQPKSKLAILPGLTHYTIFNAPALASTVIPFLDAPTAKGQ